MNVKIPEQLTPLNSINFARFVALCDDDTSFTYDFEAMQHCHPFGLLVIGSAIRRNKSRYPNASHVIVNYESNQGCQFASSFGFFQSAGFDIGDISEELDGGYRFVPIKKITAASLHSEYSDIALLNEKVDRHARQLSDILVGDQPQSIRDAIQYCFREIMRNVFEHAKIDELWVCGQYWPSRHEAEIAILDEGIGILNSLSSNPRIYADTCLEANKLALQPGLSRTLGMKQDPSDIWQNSGYGLYVASTITALNGGYFILSSGDSAIFINDRKEECPYDSMQVGTAICLNLRINRRGLRNFNNSLSAIVKEAERSAQQNGKRRIVTASKITSIASIIKNIESTYEQNTLTSSRDLIGDRLIPINSVVSFMPTTVNRRGELLGIFDYNKDTYNGTLLNVSGTNRALYLKNKAPVVSIVRKCNEGVYVLLEKHKYVKLQKNMQKR